MNLNHNSEFQLQTRLITTLDNFIHRRDDFKNRFFHLLLTLDSKRIPSENYALLFDHVFHTFHIVITLLKKKNIREEPSQKIYRIIFTLIEAHPWITEFSELNSELKKLADDCLALFPKTDPLPQNSTSRK